MLLKTLPWTRAAMVGLMWLGTAILAGVGGAVTETVKDRIKDRINATKDGSDG